MWYVLLFIYSKIVYIFSSSSFSSSSSPFFLSSPHYLYCFGFLFVVLIFDSTSHFWLPPLLCPSLLCPSCCTLSLWFCSSLTSLPDWFLCLSILSSNATRAASPPMASGAALVCSLMMRLQTGTSCRSQ